MTFPDIKLVDAPTSTANVLFDFNDTAATPSREVLADNFSIGAPELIGDVEAISPLYSERVVSFTCRMTGTKAQVAAAQSTLSRRLLANGQGWLQVRMTPTSRLLFFRAYRPQPGDLSLDLLQSVSTTKRESWELPLEIPCEPFAYGERVTAPARVVNQDPGAATSYPTFLLHDTLIGDAPTSLRYRITSSSTFSGRTRMLISHYAAGSLASPSRVNFGTGDGVLASSDVTVVTGDSSYTGGSYRRVAFTSPPSYVMAPSVGVIPGRYKVLVRATVSDATTVVAITAAQTFDSGESISAAPVRVSSPVGSGGTWVDVGEFAFPFRGPQSALDQPSSSQTNLTLNLARVSGTGTLALDHIMYVPVSRPDISSAATVAVEGVNLWTISDRGLVVDGDTSDAWGIVPSTGAILDNVPTVSGVFPSAVPGIYNYSAILFSSHPNAPADAIARNLTVTVSYFPRFLYVGDL